MAQSWPQPMGAREVDTWEIPKWATCYQLVHQLYQLFINLLSTFYQLFINFINCLSTLSTFYQLFINFIKFLSTFYQLYQLFLSIFYQCCIICLATLSTFFINSLSTLSTCLSTELDLDVHSLLEEAPGIADLL